MVEDFSNRIGKRHISLTLFERPTPDDIADLMRRREEHQKRTQPEPTSSFAEVLSHTGEQDQASAHKVQAPADTQPADTKVGAAAAADKKLGPSRIPGPNALVTGGHRRIIKG